MTQAKNFCSFDMMPRLAIIRYNAAAAIIGADIMAYRLSKILSNNSNGELVTVSLPKYLLHLIKADQTSIPSHALTTSPTTNDRTATEPDIKNISVKRCLKLRDLATEI